MVLGDDKVRRAGRADDDIRTVNGGEKVFEADGRAVERLGQLLGALVGAVADEDGAGAAAQQVPRGELAHLARADDEDGFARERAEDFLGEFDGGVRDRYGRRPDGGFAAHSPRHRQ